ncbi:MAG: ParB N-terminal domain-containing protein [Oscillospiraceae bacterium]|nr:ParB N-terminal domain-containing protein [Oscillospiraceae bacterium]
MKIERKQLAELIPASYNPRRELQPGDPEFEALKQSIEQFGCVEPIIFNATTGNVVGGHQRLNVLLAMGETETECVIVELDQAQEKALNVALNKITGAWDNDKLDALLRELHDVDLLAATGFSHEEYDELINRVNLDDFFGEGEPPVKASDAKPEICPHCGGEL